jgi:enterochelin esterase-like enzyme
MPRWPVVLIAAAWLAVGLASAYGYAHRYAIYRGFPPPRVPAGVAAGSVRTMSFWSPSVRQRTQYLVYLPPGYAQAAARGRRYPVLYLLHGYPGKMPLWLHVDPVGVQADVLIAHHRMPPVIMVMPSGKTGALGADTEWADTPSGRWMSYVMDVVHDVDHRFATRADRAHRGVAGPSEGAFGAVNIALHHLADFGVIESWGGYFTETPTAVFSGASRSLLRANSPADYVGSLAPQIRRLGLHAWLYQGRSDHMGTGAMLRFAAQLRAAGADVRDALFRGGHDWGLFRAKTPRMLAAAARWLSAPAARSPGRGTRRPAASAGRGGTRRAPPA